MTFLAQCFGDKWQTDWLIVALVLTVAVVLRILWKVQRDLDNKVNFADWLLGPDGKASWAKASGIGGFMVGTWCMVYTTLEQKVPDNYIELFLCYMLVVVGNPAAFEALRRFRPLPGEQARPFAEGGNQ